MNFKFIVDNIKYTLFMKDVILYYRQNNKILPPEAYTIVSSMACKYGLKYNMDAHILLIEYINTLEKA